jgi:dTDP-glucose pyrophosphorylase
MNRYLINRSTSILEALKIMDVCRRKILIIIYKNKFSGLISIGDIQRAIIKNISLDTPIGNIIRTNIRIATPADSFESIKSMMLNYRMELCPVVTHDNVIVKVYFWEDVFSGQTPKPAKFFDLPVVIMAGGKGSRLRPLTNVLPKPLIPIGDKTIIEEIFDRFKQHGCKNFYISVNYKAELIEYYVNNLALDIGTIFFREDKPLGTAGSLGLLKGKIDSSFFVTNCDIIIEQDYSDIIEYHRESKNELTIVAALKHYPIAYGTIETGENGKLINFIEKPEITLKINSGMYLLEPHLLDEIPENEFFHITHLINQINSRGGQVGVFPVSEKSWKDIGEWKEYLKTFS